ncbi:MAG: hypothetical protein DRJ31_10655 [Candidatus Methanomethylicota archaeon]|uniref:Uncharacterized protein n=1 Tax=Thermoproteota archaeon TaxID=2056631 RepID=A0A497EK79_9CREN|nr:MAG: hypothetical protein DRJ31_10655 [Candidatus Verstraetearchaeota archaeon]
MLYGKALITQYELVSDICVDKSMQECLDYSTSVTGWRTTVIYYKPEQGVIRFEHRYYNPKGLYLHPLMSKEIEERGRVATEFIYKIAFTMPLG